VQSAAIIALSILAAVAYGILHDQGTARVCVEYFTVGHPDLFGTDDPTLLGLAWGIVATWWAGAILGVGLAVAARAGRAPPRPAAALVRPVLRLLVLVAVGAFLAGTVGWALGRAGVVFLVEPLVSQIPPHRHARFLAALWAHSASYLLAFGGGLALMVRVWRLRRA
jgi:hypothetical protein